jgi:hypothetical protein
VKGSEDLLAERRRIHGPSAFGAFEQGSSDVAFKAVDLGDQHRLLDAEMVSGLAQCLVASGGGEPVQSLPGLTSRYSGLTSMTTGPRSVTRK